jgi:hypothetical protein
MMNIWRGHEAKADMCPPSMNICAKLFWASIFRDDSGFRGKSFCFALSAIRACIGVKDEGSGPQYAADDRKIVAP